MSRRTNSQNWFNTLNAALEAEGLVSAWPVGVTMTYNETVSFAKGGRFITVYRSNSGFYERPISYATLMDDTYPSEEAA
jgi:hypothetical protein